MRDVLSTLAAIAGIAAGGVLASACSQVPRITTADELCRSWRHQSVSKADKLSQGTAEIAEGNNRARPAWGCEPGKNEAKKG